MKHFFSFFLLFAVFSIGLRAQQWQCFQPENTAYYQSQSGNIRAVKIDSVNTAGNLVRYRLLKSLLKPDPTGDCYLPDTASWLGNWITNYPDGVQEFLTIYQDTLTIRTQAGVQDSWTFFHHKDMGYSIIATITGLSIQTIAGTTDSVKYISLQMKDSLGNSIAGPLNDYHIELSKNHGFYVIFCLGKIPELTLLNEPQYTLAGGESPSFGIKNLRLNDIYNFEIGDEFHFRQYRSHYEWHEISDYSNLLTIRKVINKHVYAGTDSISYDFWVASQIFSQFGSPPEPEVVTYNETITYHSEGSNPVSIPVLKITDLKLLTDLLPEENSWVGQYRTIADELFTNQNFNERMQKRVQTYDMNALNGGCYIDFDLLFQWNKLIQYSFISGCGGPYYNYSYDNGLYGIQNVAQKNIDTLLYFKKGAEEWGIPIDTTGWKIPQAIKEIANDRIIAVYPSPARDVLTIEIKEKITGNLYLKVADLLGNTILTSNLGMEKSIIDISQWNRGVYLVEIYRDNQLLKICKLIAG